jgi:hypothetical protein
MSGMASPPTPGSAIPGQEPPVGIGAPTPAVSPGAPIGQGPDGLMQMGEAAGGPPGPGAPGAPTPPAAAPIALTPDGKIDVAAEQKKTLASQDQNALDAETAEKKIGDVNALNAGGASTAADQEAAIALQKQKDDQKAIDTANQQTQGWVTKAQQDAQKYQGMGLHDYWDHQSTGNKVLAGISVMFGAAGRANGNPGLDMVNKAIDRDFDMQQANIAKAKSNVETDQRMVDMGLTAKQSALADNNLKKAGALDATAAQLQSYLMKQGVPLAQAQTDKNVAALREKANATRMETLEQVHTQNIQDSRLKIEQQNADTARIRAEKYKTRQGHGGGGGGTSALSKFVEAAGQLGPGDQITPDIAVLGRQAGLKPNQIAAEVDRYRNSGAKSNKLGAADPLVKDIDKRADTYEKEAVGNAKSPGPIGQVQRINGMQNSLSRAIASGDQAAAKAAIASITEEAGGMMSGGKTTAATIKILHENMASASDELAAKWGYLTGNPGASEAFQKRIGNMLKGLKEEKLGQAKDIQDRFDKELGATATSEPAKARLKARREGIFSGMGGSPSGGVTPKMARARAILADPAAKGRLDNGGLARMQQMAEGR